MQHFIRQFVLFALAAALVGCSGPTSAPRQAQATTTLEPGVVVTREIIHVMPPGSPLSTPIVYATRPSPLVQYPDRVVVNLAGINTPAIGQDTISITLTLAQHLVVTLPAEATLGMIVRYIVHYDEFNDRTSIVEMADGIDPAHPPATGWVWAARKTGEVLIGIVATWTCRTCGAPYLYYDLRVHVVP